MGSEFQAARRRLFLAADWLKVAGSVLIFGPPGAQVYTALSEISAMGAQDLRVIRASGFHDAVPGGLGTLGDLAGHLDADDWDQVPSVHRSVLTALVEGRWSAEPLSAIAIAPAVLSLLNAAGRDRPLLLVLEQVQLLAPETADVLRLVFAGIEGSPIRVIAGETVRGDDALVGHHLCPSPLLVIGLEAVRVARLPRVRSRRIIASNATRHCARRHAVRGRGVRGRRGWDPGE